MAGLCKECSYHTVEGKGNGMKIVAANQNGRLNQKQDENAINPARGEGVAVVLVVAVRSFCKIPNIRQVQSLIGTPIVSS